MLILGGFLLTWVIEPVRVTHWLSLAKIRGVLHRVAAHKSNIRQFSLRLEWLGGVGYVPQSFAPESDTSVCGLDAFPRLREFVRQSLMLLCQVTSTWSFVDQDLVT